MEEPSIIFQPSIIDTGEFGPREWLKLSAVSTFFMLKVFQLKKITMGAIGSNTVKEALRPELVFPVCTSDIRYMCKPLFN